MTEFKDLSGEAKQALLGQITNACKEAGVSDKVKFSGTTAHVGILNAGQLQQQGGAGIKGTIGLDMNEKCEALKETIKKLCSENNTTLSVDIACKYAPGDKVAPIANITPLKFEEGGTAMTAGDNVTLSHEEGQVILLDLWATWCPPCQQPMKHNVDMLAKGKEAWKGKVRLIGLGTDQEKEKLCTHIVAKGFHNHVEHYWAQNGTCQINAQLGAGGIPHVALLNPKGEIVYKGHPSSIDLEKAIDDLLATGESSLCPMPTGEKAAAKEGEEEKAGDAFPGDASAYVAKFKEKVNEMIGDAELVKSCGSMQRAFFVLEEKATFNSEKGTLETNFEMHLVLIGGGEKDDLVAKIKDLTKELRETTGVKVNEQIQ